MALYATGFNAWNQLNFESSPTDREPDDLFAFAKALTDKTIGYIVPKINFTAGKYYVRITVLIVTLILNSPAK